MPINGVHGSRLAGSHVLSKRRGKSKKIRLDLCCLSCSCSNLDILRSWRALLTHVPLAVSFRSTCGPCRLASEIIFHSIVSSDKVQLVVSSASNATWQLISGLFRFSQDRL